MNNRLGPHWQGYVGQHLAEWEQGGNRSIFDRLEMEPPAYNSSLPHIPPHIRLSRNDDFVQHNIGGSVFDRLVRPQKLNENSKKQAKLSKAHQWRMRNDSQNGRAANEVAVTGSVLDAITALSNALVTTSDWDAVIQDALNSVQITQEEIDQKELVLGLIEQTLKAKFPRAICRLFGSSETKLGFKDSDADIYVSLGHDPYNNATKKEGKAKAAKLTRQLGFCFKGHTELRLASTITHCRVPLVKLYHKPSKTRVDLSFRSAFGVSNSSLVRLLCDSHPLVRPFVLFLRLWATSHNISGPGRPSNLLTNYTLSLLALFTCMAREQRLVPSLEDLRRQSFDSNVIDGWECGYGTDVTAYWQQQEKGPPTTVEGGVLALAVEFFELFAGLDYLRYAVCPMVGSLVDRDALQAAADAAPAVDTGVTDSDWGETDYEAPADTDGVNDNTGMITDNGTDDAMIADTVGTGVSIATDAVAADAAVTIDVATGAAAQIGSAVNDLVVTSVFVEENTTIQTGTGAKSGAVTKDTGMEVIATVAEDAAVTSDIVTEVINHHDHTNAAAAAANSITDTATDPAAGGGNTNIPEALLPHLAKFKNMDKRKIPLCVMDVFVLDTNITSHYRLKNVKTFQKKCRISAKILKEVLKQEKPLSALFSKPEIS